MAGCGEFGVACSGGQEGEQGRERGLAGAISGSKFPGTGEPARLLASKFLAGEGAWGGEGGVHVYRRGEGGSRFHFNLQVASPQHLTLNITNLN